MKTTLALRNILNATCQLIVTYCDNDSPVIVVSSEWFRQYVSSMFLYPQQVKAIEADLVTDEGIKKIVSETLESFGTIHILVT